VLWAPGYEEEEEERTLFVFSFCRLSEDTPVAHTQWVGAWVGAICSSLLLS